MAMACSAQHSTYSRAPNHGAILPSPKDLINQHHLRGLPKYPQRALHLSGSDARFGGVHFSGPPHFDPLGFFWVFLLYLGSTAPNYSRRPPTRSSKAPPNHKIKGKFYPTPPNLTSATSARQGYLGTSIISPPFFYICVCMDIYTYV